jgi:ferredoxin
MKTVIYYYTGTGNSLWTARLLAAELDDAEVQPMVRVIRDGVAPEADVVGMVFPVHSWGVPSLVIQFLKVIRENPARYYFACAVNAGQVSRTLVQLQKLMLSYGLSLSAGFDIALPSNYIPWGGPGSAANRQELYDVADRKVRQAAAYVSREESGLVERGPLWQRIVFSAVYKMSFSAMPRMDRSFWVDEKCNACAVCASVCPVGNIVMEAERPTWQHHCEQCLACLQWCPREAIQYGKKTAAYERYHHPEVKLKDMMLTSDKPDSL